MFSQADGGGMIQFVASTRPLRADSGGPAGNDSLSIALECARRDDALPQKQREMRRHVAKQWRCQHRCSVGLGLTSAEQPVSRGKVRRGGMGGRTRVQNRM